MTKEPLINDTECWPNYWFAAFKRVSDGKVVTFELSERATFDPKRLYGLLVKYQIITFNGLTYDMPMMMFAIQVMARVRDGEIDVAEGNRLLKEASDSIIKSNLKPWETERALGVRVPREVDHIDLIEPQPQAEQGGFPVSLKLLAGRMHAKWMQDLPFDPDDLLALDDMAMASRYCVNDLDNTEMLFKQLAGPLADRVALSAKYGQDFRSKSDAQIGEAIVRIGVERITKKKAVKQAADRTFKYPIPTWAKFETPALQQLVRDIADATFYLDDKKKVIKPPALADRQITIDNTTYSIGIGGIHSTEEGRSLRADSDFVLIDADVASQYPSAILSLGLAPKSLGPAFLVVYRGIRDGRVAAKKRVKTIKALLKESPAMAAPDAARLVAEQAACAVQDKGGKIALNGVYGKLGSSYSIVFAPHLMVGTTISCQLSILLLIERLRPHGYEVVSANTDGVLIRCRRDAYDGIVGDRLKPGRLAGIVDQWEADTGFALEFAEFAAIYNSSVNSYFAIKANGGHKRKGPLGNPWNEHPDDKDLVRGQLMKNPQMTILSDAVLARIKDGTPVEQTIRACTDIRQFVTVIRAQGGATWRGEKIGKVIRYYWSEDGDPMLRKSGAQVANTAGCAPCMILPDELPYDLDYPRYIAAAEQILKDYGFYGQKLPPQKKVRMTKKNRPHLMRWLEVAF